MHLYCPKLHIQSLIKFNVFLFLRVHIPPPLTVRKHKNTNKKIAFNGSIFFTVNIISLKTKMVIFSHVFYENVATIIPSLVLSLHIKEWFKKCKMWKQVLGSFHREFYCLCEFQTLNYKTTSLFLALTLFKRKYRTFQLQEVTHENTLLWVVRGMTDCYLLLTVKILRTVLQWLKN